MYVLLFAVQRALHLNFTIWGGRSGESLNVSGIHANYRSLLTVQRSLFKILFYDGVFCRHCLGRDEFLQKQLV